MTVKRRARVPWRAVLLGSVLVVAAVGAVTVAARADSAPEGTVVLAGVDAPAAAAGAAAPESSPAADVTAPRQQLPRRQPAGQPLGCEGCHGELELLRQQTGSLARAEQVFVPNHIVAASAHGDRSCAECHAGYTRYPHDERTTRTQTCQSCHVDATTHWQAGSHATADDQVTCVQCHTTHDVRSVEELRSP
jgi:hypothetical protein